ncbi:MAG: NINE protein [Chloroflexota bacterium]|nr:NINE protein [Chloroflexota bacterium]
MVEKSKSKVAAGVLALLLGGLGVHKFYLGRVGAGIVHIILSIIIIGIPVNWVICLIEAIIYFTKSDGEFHQTYVVNRKSFF